MRLSTIILFLLLSFATVFSKDIRKVTVILKEKETFLPVEGVTVYLKNEDQTGNGAISNKLGRVLLKSQNGESKIYISHLSYKPVSQSITIVGDTILHFFLEKENYNIGEVKITAMESKGLSSSSTINRDAMEHLQPNCLTDVMSLLPGGISSDPDMGEANTIALRETGTLSATGSKTVNTDYSISSLGTLFVIDGTPVNTDANLQYIPSGLEETDESQRNITNRGVDMRTISTDDIESVEVVRGIPSVEYGNLTSGMVKIRKIRKVTDLRTRFKSDGYNNLVSVGKGFKLPHYENTIVNIDAGFLDSKIDPRNSLENYKRLTGSLRLTNNQTHENFSLYLTPSLDYSGSFDNYKQDPDINYGDEDSYKSTYNSIALRNNMGFTFPKNNFIEKIDVNTSVKMQFDRLERVKLVSPQRVAIAPTSYEEGESDAQLLYEEYTSEYTCDGKPFDAYVKLSGDFNHSFAGFNNSIKVGGDWSLSKNFGDGQIFDLSHPMSSYGWGTRPRAYKDIPALQNLSFFFQDYISNSIGNHQLDLRLGVRTNSLPGIDKAYALHGKTYFDPRFNAQWTFPQIALGEKYLEISLSGGIGWTSKMPTLNYLYPDPVYIDIIQLAYYDQNNPEEYSRYNILTYKEEATNYDIEPARNKKWEIRADFELDENRLFVCYFREAMTSGFRYSNTYTPYTYKDYEEDSIVSSSLTAQPDLNDVLYETKTELNGYSFVENGSRLLKEGIEFQFTSKRIKALRTKINLNGAWFKSTYTNSRPMYYAVSDVVDDVTIKDQYVGLYDWVSGRVNQQFSTNLMFDTQIPEIGLIFSTAIQSKWFVSTQRQMQNGEPVSYLDASDGELHPYTDEAVDDNYMLQYLVYEIGEASYEKYTIPTAMYLNLKVTKKIGKRMKLAFFANRLFDYTPDFERNGVTIRRNISPYFGMEFNFKI